MRWKKALVMTLAACVGLGMQGHSVGAATVGISPCDGETMFVKQFSVLAGATITGVEFQNNDAETVFPEVVLVRGGGASLSEGTEVRSATNVSETASGLVQVTWSPLVASEAGTYRVGVRFPAGPGKEGPGDGPGIGATAVRTPNGSFVAGGENGDLTAAEVDLAMTLLVSGGTGKASVEEPGATVARTFLGSVSPNPSNPSTTIEFGVAPASEVRLTIYDVRGRPVRELIRARLAAGTYHEVWNGRDDAGQGVAAGIYMVRLIAGDQLLQKKITLVK